MIELPYLNDSSSPTRQQVLRFGGVQYGMGGQDGELSESTNLSSRQWPALSQRLGRSAAGTYVSPTAMLCKDKLCVVDGTSLIYDGETVGAVTAGEKQMAAVNSKICVFPDKVYYDVETETFGPMAQTVTLTAAKVTFTADTLTVSENPVTGKTLADLFARNQAVEISGCSIAANNQTIIIRGAQGNTLTFYENSFTAGSTTTDVTVARNIPELLYLCESDNRLWGVDGKTIWASALGDPLTFYNYDGLSTDSYAVAVGSEGAFTGCCAYSGNVLFFKENALHKLMGSEPGEYRIYPSTVPGVQEGCADSMEVVNEVLYYKGTAGVYAYTGGAPALVSENFGTRRFGKARGGTDGGNYYISMQDLDTLAWGFYVFDALRGVWLREDGSHAVGIGRLDGAVYLLSADDGKLYQMGGAGERVSWEATLYPFDWTVPEQKDYTRLYLDAQLEAGAYLKVELREDGGPWRQAALHHAQRQRSFTVPIAPNRCDTLQLRISGSGGCVLRQVSREYVIGGKR